MWHQIALSLLFVTVGMAGASSMGVEMALANVTRFSPGDLFSLFGTDCGPTRCMEMSHGTALAAIGSAGCECQCRRETPAFREDQQLCVYHIDECATASFGRGAPRPQIPFVFLPLKGQIIYPAKEIIFTDVAGAICAVTSAQYLSPSGWVTLRDVVDNDVPFSLYRDEGSTFLQWRGSPALHARLEGRLVAAHVLCSSPEHSRLAATCAAFRIAGASQNSLLDVKSIPFHAGEIVTSEPATTKNQGLSVLELLAICVCVLMIIFIYAAGIIFYINYKQRQKRKEKDPEMNMSNTLSTDNGSTLDSRINMENMQLKTNPLLNMTSLSNDFLHDAGLSDVSEHTEDTLESSPPNFHKFQKTHSNVVSAVVHQRRNKPLRPIARATSTPERITERLQRRSASPDTLERAPHSDLSIVDCSQENNTVARQPLQSPNGEPVLRKKLYFNPVFFETEHLKNPPPAALEFIMKIREVMSVAKEKMTSKRFIPILTDIPEEELYHTIDLGWDLPCARRGRRFSAISLKHENSRRAIHCGGCPGCDSSTISHKNTTLLRSNSCKTCVSDDYKQRIVRKWLDDVPSPSVVKPIKSVAKVAKVSGTPRNADLVVKTEEETQKSPQIKREKSVTLKDNTENLKKNVDKFFVENDLIQCEINTETTHTIVIPEKISPPKSRSRRIRRSLPPPPPPPVCPPHPKEEDTAPILPEVKIKMEAVIRELNKCRRIDQKNEEEKFETPTATKIVIPVNALETEYNSDDNLLCDKRKKSWYTQNALIDSDSLERNEMRQRRFSLACEPELAHAELLRFQQNMQTSNERLSSSWRTIKQPMNNFALFPISTSYENKNAILISSNDLVFGNANPGSLTIQVTGSPVEKVRNPNEEFDPDTLDRKPKKESEKRVERIVLKSGESFKFKTPENLSKPKEVKTEETFSRKNGSLRQIYEAKQQSIDGVAVVIGRRGSIPFLSSELSEFSSNTKAPDLLLQTNVPKDNKPPIPPKQRRGSNLLSNVYNSSSVSPPSNILRLSEELDDFPPLLKQDNISAHRSGRRPVRNRTRRTDFKKPYKTEDSGYMSTDSNESKRRAKYLLQLKPRLTESSPPIKVPIPKALSLNIESDTDELESLCDGRSESGGESVETDSVFFGSIDDSKDMLAELGLSNFDITNPLRMTQDQIDSGFVGETNIILSCDSDSEHKSIISIIAGSDGRTSAASITKLDDPPYVRSVEC